MDSKRKNGSYFANFSNHATYFIDNLLNAAQRVQCNSHLVV